MEMTSEELNTIFFNNLRKRAQGIVADVQRVIPEASPALHAMFAVMLAQEIALVALNCVTVACGKGSNPEHFSALAKIWLTFGKTTSLFTEICSDLLSSFLTVTTPTESK